MAERNEAKKRFFRRKKKKGCVFCIERIEVSYKDVDRLQRFLSERGKIIPKRVTGNCAKHQRMLARAIKRARELALLPYTVE
ncbi:MAG: 30S ribosomal protein S18 [Candidatus Atribacteria bacterium]|nr:30S ribosomal protein S18 [Candidatus Atribacteria bacterium]MCD6349785.1 30S ribosomal protein S18 [Candidatus Atribacteria bacterium]